MEEDVLRPSVCSAYSRVQSNPRHIRVRTRTNPLRISRGWQVRTGSPGSCYYALCRSPTQRSCDGKPPRLANGCVLLEEPGRGQVVRFASDRHEVARHYLKDADVDPNSRSG